jgi:CHASE3 domain sensor protein
MHIERKIKLVFLVAIAVMLVTAVVPFHTVSRATELRDTLLASEAKILQLTNVLSLMKDAETGQRGFIITGQDSFLAPYNEALARLDGIRKSLRESLDAGRQEREAGQLDALLERKLKDLARTIELRRSGGFEAVRPIVITAQGKQYMDDVRVLAGRLTEDEELRRRHLQSEADQSALLGRAPCLPPPSSTSSW